MKVYVQCFSFFRLLISEFGVSILKHSFFRCPFTGVRQISEFQQSRGPVSVTLREPKMTFQCSTDGIEARHEGG